MTEDEWENRACYRLAAEAVRRKNLRREPIEAWLATLYDRLDIKVRMSRARQENGCPAAESEVNDSWIGSPEAAAILGWSKRQVQRCAPDLDGQIVAGRWLFRESLVKEYASERDNDGQTAGGAGGVSRFPGR